MFLKLFTSFTHYTSYSLLNIVHVTVWVFGLTNQVCKYLKFLCKTDLMLENLWRMFENLNFGKLGLKFEFLKNFASHTHAFYSYFSMLWGFYAKTWLFFQNCVFFWNFNRLRLFFGQSKLVQIFWWASVCFDQSNLIFQSIENRMRSFLKQIFSWVKHFFKKVL